MNIGITTAPRACDYLGPLLETIPGQHQVCIAPTREEDLPFCRDFPTMDPLGTGLDCEVALNRNTDRLIRKLAIEGSPFLMLQDDASPCPMAFQRVAMVAEWMRDLRSRPIAWVSFYTPYGECGSYPKALWPYRAGTFYGDIAMLWSCDAATAFVTRHEQLLHHDMAVQGFFGSRPGFKTFGHSPCLFQHIGVHSATGKQWQGAQRDSMNWSAAHNAIDDAKPL